MSNLSILNFRLSADVSKFTVTIRRCVWMLPIWPMHGQSGAPPCIEHLHGHGVDANVPPPPPRVGTPCTHGRRKRGRDGGDASPPMKKLGGDVLSIFENEVAQIRCLFRFLGYFGGRLATCRRFVPSAQKSVAAPLPAPLRRCVWHLSTLCPSAAAGCRVRDDPDQGL